MVGANKVMAGARRVEMPAYTVVAKSGQRGMPFNDPALAALAFARADESDRPFVLHHRGDRSVVIALTKCGRKSLQAGQDSEGDFRTALRLLDVVLAVDGA